MDQSQVSTGSRDPPPPITAHLAPQPREEVRQAARVEVQRLAHRVKSAGDQSEVSIRSRDLVSTNDSSPEDALHARLVVEPLEGLDRVLAADQLLCLTGHGGGSGVTKPHCGSTLYTLDNSTALHSVCFVLSGVHTDTDN